MLRPPMDSPPPADTARRLDCGRCGRPDRTAGCLRLGRARRSHADHEYPGAQATHYCRGFRLLRPGGRYGIHELCLVPDDISAAKRDEVYSSLSSVLHVGARPLPSAEWRGLLETVGFQVEYSGYAPMRLLGLRRLIQDEGIWGALRLAKNICLQAPARRRVLLCAGSLGNTRTTSAPSFWS